jgi:hypothetical protein
MKIPLLRNHLLELSQVDHGFIAQRVNTPHRFFDAWTFTDPHLAAHFFVNTSSSAKPGQRPIFGLKQIRNRQGWTNLLTGRPIYGSPRLGRY